MPYDNACHVDCRLAADSLSNMNAARLKLAIGDSAPSRQLAAISQPHKKMPIVDIELVCRTESEVETVSARALADELGRVFASDPGRTWVRVRYLAQNAYAENGIEIAPSELPVFVTVLQAHPQQGAALTTEMIAVTDAVANLVARPRARVHVQYAPAAAGRQAFGGRLVE